MFLKRAFYFLIALLIFVVISFTSLYYYTEQYFLEPGELSEETVIVIPPGKNTKAISYLLADNKIISMPDLFYWTLRATNKDKSLQAGEYIFYPKTTPRQVLSKLINGDVLVHKITIPEGLSTKQILDLIDQNQDLTGSIQKNIPEGVLLPETYKFTLGESKEMIVNRMKKSMQETLDAAWENRSNNSPLKSKEEALILASIIEKETGVPEERSRVAGVFINRLRKSMRLQTDPTVIYAITKGEYVLERPLTKADLKTKSPYNTYLNSGLPPGPIANPGRNSIIAALNPVSTQDLYFVADGSGGHAFAKTLSEHIRNVHKWRKIKKERKLKSRESDASIN